MKRNTITTGILIALAAISFAGIAAAGDHGHRGRDGRGFDGAGGGPEGMLRELQLTDTQKDQIKALKEKNKDAAKKLREEIRGLHEQMRAAWETETPDRKKILGIHNQIHTAKGKIAAQRIDFRLSVHKILTPEQRKQAVELLKERHQDMSQGEGGPDGEGCPCGKGPRGRGHGPRW